MSSLWTPEGEYRIPRSKDDESKERPRATPGATGAKPSSLSSSASSYDHDAVAKEHGPEDEVSLSPTEQLAKLEAELAETPVEDVIANHCYGLFQLAALHLSAEKARTREARLAIDALGAIIEKLGSRLGASFEPLSQGLSQIQLAFVHIASQAPATTSSPDGDKAASDTSSSKPS